MLLPSALAPTRARTMWIRPRAGKTPDAATLHAVVRETDPRVPIDELTTAGDRLALYESDHRGAFTATVTLGIVALLLSAACGVGIAMAAGVILRSLLYGTSPIDLVALAGASAVLVLVLGAAAATPSWRAAQVDPMVVLRHD